MTSLPGRNGRPAKTTDSKMYVVLELWRFLRVRKKYWLMPIVVLMFVVGGLLLLAEGSAISPFMYTIF